VWFDLGQANTLSNIGSIYRHQSRVYRDQGKLGEALKFFQQALALFREIGYRQGEAGTLHEIGNVYADQGKLGEALKFFQQALALFREIGYRQGEAIALYSIGIVYRDQGNFEKALEKVKQAHALYQNIGRQAQEFAKIEEVMQQLTNLQKSRSD
jgi:tetratricopeptide (TPR) repeat protein